MHAVRISRLSALGGLLLTSSLIGMAAPAAAQVVGSPDEVALARTGLFARDQNIGVLDRPRPDYAPLGIRFDSLKIQPELDSSMEYNSNIYAIPTDVKDAEIFHLSPSVTATTDWSRNQLSFFARDSLNQYLDHTSESTDNYALGTTGRLDVANNIGLAAGATYEHDSESRTSPNSPVTATKPIEYDLTSVYGAGAIAFTNLRLSARGDYQTYNYDNGQTAGGGLVYQKDRDYAIASGTFRAEYAALPGTSVFANLVVNHQQNYNLFLGDPSRTGDGYEATVGSNFDITHLIRGEVFIGYLDQSFDSHGYKEVTGISLRGYVQYFFTPLLTLTLSGSRVPVDSDIVGAGAFLDSNVSLRGDYELLRNLLLTGTVTYENDSYTGIDRNDKRNFETFGATYLLNRAVGVSLTYQHTQNDSSGFVSGLSFDINSLTAGVTLRY